MTRSRRTFSSQEKAKMVLRHLIDKTPVSDLCDEFGHHPTQIYIWKKQLTDNAALVLHSKRIGTSGISVGDGTLAGERNPQQCKTKSSMNISKD